MNATQDPRSWATEVIADNSGQWCGNACRYATQELATEAAKSLAARWTLVREWRVVPSGDEPNRTGEPVSRREARNRYTGD